MNFKHVMLGTAAVAAAFCASSAMAAVAPSIGDVLTASGVTYSGWISGGYQHGFNSVRQANELTDEGGDPLFDPALPDLALRTFDSKDDSFLLNQAVLNLAMLPASGFGGAVTLLAGEDAQIVSNSFGDGDHKFVANQAYIQYASGPLTVIGGRYNTLAGAEVIADPANTNISRSLLFTFAEPFVHTGIRTAWKFSDQLTAYLGVNNSAVGGAAQDPDQRKTVEAGVAFTPTSMVSLALYDYYGKEGTVGTLINAIDGTGATANAKTNYLDFVGTLSVSDALQFILNADYVKVTSSDSGDAGQGSIAGVAGYANWKLSSLYRLCLRAEYLKVNPDLDAADSENVKSYTLTFDYSPAKNFDLLAEGRLDDAKDDIFVDGVKAGVPDTTDTQSDVAIKAIYKFGG